MVPSAFEGLVSRSRHCMSHGASVGVETLACLAIAIFLFDTVTDREIAVAVFYVLIVLGASRLFPARGVIFVAGSCIALALISYFLSSSGSRESGLANLVIGLIAIGATTYLVVRIKEAEIATQSAHAQLAHVTRVTTLNELTTSIAHEINQPLAAVVINSSACSRWLSADPPNLSEARVALQRIVQDANRASDIIGRIRVLAGKGPVSREPLHLNEITLETMALMQTSLERDAIHLRASLADTLPLVNGDRILLQQVVLNLVANAVESLKEQQTSREVVIATTLAEGRHLNLSVSDMGRGIEPEDLEKIFDAFHTRKPGGAGLGLTISRTIIEAHGGHIWASMNQPRGTVVQFSLPAIERATR